MASTEEKEALKEKIRTQGISFHLSMPTKIQRKELLKADIIRMVENNLDAIVSEENDPALDIKKIFSRH